MICPGPSDEPIAAFELWKSKADGLAAVDYTFHMSVVRFEEHIRSQFREIVKAGVASFKVFLAYKGALNLSDEHLFAAMQLAKDLGVIVTAHCENADAIDALQKSLLAAGKTGRCINVKADVHHAHPPTPSTNNDDRRCGHTNTSAP